MNSFLARSARAGSPSTRRSSRTRARSAARSTRSARGENNNGLYYDKAILQKAGIKLPWQPKTWADIITAAKAIKKAEPKIIPLWTDAGTSAGPNGAGYGILNLLAGSRHPDDPDCLGQDGRLVQGPARDAELLPHGVRRRLGAPTSQLFSANNAPNIPSADFAKGTLGIAVGANFIGGNWTKQVSFPYWPQASTAMGIAGIPKINGGGYASTLSGWDFGMSSKTKTRDRGGGAREHDAGADQPDRGGQLGRLGPAGQVRLDRTRCTRTSTRRSTRSSASCCPGRVELPSELQLQRLGPGRSSRRRARWPRPRARPERPRWRP